MLTVTYDEFIAFQPCWLEEEGGEERLKKYFDKKPEWSALDILKLKEVPIEDRLWAVLRP